MKKLIKNANDFVLAVLMLALSLFLLLYHKLNGALPAAQTTEAFQEALSHGQVTEKEKTLWEFVLSAYGGAEFSTKQLEKDFGNAAYATIRSFVLKFEKLGLLKSTQYGNRMKYAVCV